MHIQDISGCKHAPFLRAVRRLNNRATPHVNALGVRHVRWLLGQSMLALAATSSSAPQARQNSPSGLAGVLWALPSGVAYASANYQWFEKHYDNFAYIDRVVIARSYQGRGLGRCFYTQLFAACRAEGRAWVLCEVNVKPANAVSLAFHKRLGFEVVAECEHSGKTVAMMARRV